MDQEQRVRLVESRVAEVISAAIAGLSPEDRAERIAYCRRTGLHGTDMKPCAEGIELHWPAGRLLAVIDRQALTDEGLSRPLGMAPLPDVPDTPEALNGWPNSDY